MSADTVWSEHELRDPCMHARAVHYRRMTLTRRPCHHLQLLDLYSVSGIHIGINLELVHLTTQ